MENGGTEMALNPKGVLQKIFLRATTALNTAWFCYLLFYIIVFTLLFLPTLIKGTS